MTIKIEKVADLLNYSDQRFNKNPNDGVVSGYAAIFNDQTFPFEGVNSLIQNLLTLNWVLPKKYEITQSTFNLSLKAASTNESLAGAFTIKHKSTGDYIVADTKSINEFLTDIHNGTISDTVMVSYGDLDKSTYTISQSVMSKYINNNIENLSSYVMSDNYTQSIISSNNTYDDKNDDYTHVLTNKVLEKKINGNMNGVYTYSDVIKSKGFNYSNIFYKTIKEDSERFSLSESVNFNYSSHTSGTKLSINLSYKDSDMIDKSVSGIDVHLYSRDISSANLKIVSDDNLDTWFLNFSGNISTDSDWFNNTVNISKYTIENKDLKITSGLIPTSLIDYDDIVNFAYILDIWNLKFAIHEPAPLEHIIYVIDALKNLNKGNNNITIKSDKGVFLDSGEGNDVFLGGRGNDTIIGGTGSDKLTGGLGSDTFMFDISDFFTANNNYDPVPNFESSFLNQPENSKKNRVFNKCVDTITDFHTSEKDVLDFNNLGNLRFFLSLKDAINTKAELFYVNGLGKIYLNTDTTGYSYSATPIITLTGNPKVNVDLSGFA